MDRPSETNGSTKRIRGFRWRTLFPADGYRSDVVSRETVVFVVFPVLAALLLSVLGTFADPPTWVLTETVVVGFVLPQLVNDRLGGGGT